MAEDDDRAREEAAYVLTEKGEAAVKKRYRDHRNVEDLTDLLTHETGYGRVFGRAIASGFMEAVENWAESELKRDTDPAEILSALITLQVQIVASMTAGFIECEGYALVEDKYVQHIREIFVQHAEAVAGERREVKAE